MTWLVWRQYRTQAAVGVAVLAAFAVLVLITGLHIASVFHADVAACTATKSCRWPAGNLILGSNIVGFLIEMTLAVPAVLGMFWGAPLVARELETGTCQFAWMQSVTRRHWFAVKTGWLLLAAVAWGGAVSALVTWWSGPRNAAYLNAFNPGDFDIQGIVPVAYAVFAMALGIAAGALIRRSLPALAVTLGGFFAVRLAIMGWVRSHYMAPVTTTFGLAQYNLPKGAIWQYAQGVLGPGGTAVPQPSGPGPVAVIGIVAGNGMAASSIPPACRPHIQSDPQASQHAVLSCLTAHGYRNFITYQPASRFWAFQGIETAIFAGLAAALIAVAAVAVLRRDA